MHCTIVVAVMVALGLSFYVVVIATNSRAVYQANAMVGGAAAGFSPYVVQYFKEEDAAGGHAARGSVADAPAAI